MFRGAQSPGSAFRRARLISAYSLAVLGICGCGGGGGGGGDAAPPAPVVPVVYAGNASGAVITSSNATKLAANVLGSGDASRIIIGPQAAGSGAAQNPSSGIADLTRRLNRGFRETLLGQTRAGSAHRLVPAAVPVDDIALCDSGSVHTSGSLNDDGTGTLAVSYDNCRLGGETLNGPAALRVDVFDLFNLIPTDLTVSFARLTLRGAGVDTDVGGSVRSQSNIGAHTETITANIVALDNIAGGMTKAENLVFVNLDTSNVSLTSSYVQTITGRVFDSVLGFVDIATTDPLIFSSTSQQFPMPGRLVLSGSGNRSVRETSVSGTQVMLELDLDGDAKYELWTTVPWTSVTGTAIVDFVRPTAPVVSIAVNSDRSVKIDWTPSTDSSGILEYRVRRGAMPLARTTVTTFTDRSVEPGSVADYYVRAVDNAGNLSDLLPPKSVKIPSTGTGTFAQPLSGTLPFASSSSGMGIGVADVNGDGNRDLVVSGGNLLQMATALGPLTAGISFSASPVDFATMNNDSNLPFFHLVNITGSDLPEALGAGRTLVWNTTGNQWADSAGSIQSFQFEARAYIDLNDDGILDIVSVGTTGNFTPILFGTLGTGNGSYDASSKKRLAGIENFAWSRIGAIAAADVDRDGLTDLIVWDGNTIRVVRQTQRGSFSVTASLPAVDNLGFRTVMLVADLTGDGYPEIVYADYAAVPDQLRVYLNDGAGGFASTAVASNILAPWNFSAADINGDGIPDLVVGNRNTTALDLYISQGNGTFTLLSSISNVGFPNISLADVDLDGDMDIVIAGASFNSTDVKVYINQ